MKNPILVCLTCLSLNVWSQQNIGKLTQPIVEEGKLLYKSEMASWYGTDVFLEQYKSRDNIGGYFSYTDGDLSKCIFFSKGDKPKVIGTMLFDSTYNTRTVRTDLQERDFTPLELDLYTIRFKALKAINSDTLFKTYNNTSLNLIPLISKHEKKVYVLTGPKNSGVVIFGNDYLLTFDDNNQLTSRKQLHKNIIPIYYKSKELEGKKVEGAIHSHLPETGDFITSTDICTLMLYEKFAKWKNHTVISEKYVSIWNCQTNELLVMTREAMEKIEKDRKDKKE